MIGLLWDSVSDNMGDVAIGLVLQRAFADAGIPYRVIDPFRPDTTDISTMVIGGGELFRAVGDPFYDVFRVAGHHILNAVGVLDGGEVDYLDSYRLVSVRSQADRDRLGRGEIVPCLALLYNDYLQEGDLLPSIPLGAIGIHINDSFQDQIVPLITWLRSANIGPIVWLPITHYNGDTLLLRELANWVPNSTFLPPLSPDATFRVIGQFSALISASLHASIFAYAQNVPTLGYRRVAKLATFLEERGQHEAIFSTSEDLQRMLPRLLKIPPNLTQRRHEDQAICRQWLTRMLSEADCALSEPHSAFSLPPANERYYRLQMDFYRENGARAAVIAHMALHLEQLRTSLVFRIANRFIWPANTYLQKLRSRF
jgi:hypothetical protein